MSDAMKYWARHKLGPERVCWVVLSLGEDHPIADGYCRTVEEAEAQARSVAGPDARQGPAYWAEERHRHKVHENRMARTARSADAQVRSYVYRRDVSDYDGHPYVLAHPVFKTTKKRVYVGRDQCILELVGTEREPKWDFGPDHRTIVLDRARLEADGEFFSRSHRWLGSFYLRAEEALDPWGYRHGGHPGGPAGQVAEALDVLGLTWPCSEREVRAAYRRLSKETHPDTGGSAESFVRINAAYEQAKAGVASWPASGGPAVPRGPRRQEGDS